MAKKLAKAPPIRMDIVAADPEAELDEMLVLEVVGAEDVLVLEAVVDRTGALVGLEDPPVVDAAAAAPPIPGQSVGPELSPET
jgi:hypothetical protein